MKADTQATVRRRDALTAYLFLAPFLAIYLILMVYPFFKGLWISLHDWELAGNYRKFIGFLNYQDLWYDAVFWKVVGNTLLFVVLTVPTMTLLALALALAVFGRGRLKGVLRSIFFMSSVFSVSVVTLLWQMVLSADKGLLVPLTDDWSHWKTSKPVASTGTTEALSPRSVSLPSPPLRTSEPPLPSSRSLPAPP